MKMYINLHKTSHVQYVKINTSSGGKLELGLKDQSVVTTATLFTNV